MPSSNVTNAYNRLQASSLLLPPLLNDSSNDSWSRHDARRAGKPPQKVRQICSDRMRLRGVGTSDGSRWLVIYAHASNGMANRFGGLRAALGLAQLGGRRLAIRWHGVTHQEAAMLVPADPGYNWSLSDAPGLSDTVRNKSIEDAWAVSMLWKGQKATWAYPSDAKMKPINSIHESTGPGCALVLEDPHPRGLADNNEVKGFMRRVQGNEPIVLIKYLTFDCPHPWMHFKQAEVAPIAYAQYHTLFRPRPALTTAVCRHLRALNLQLDKPWLGLQLRRSIPPQLELAQTSIGAHSFSWRNETVLRNHERWYVREAVNCALTARSVACSRNAAMCGAPIFVTSNSYRVQRHAARMLGNDARWAEDPTFSFHSGPGHGYMHAMLEMAVFSASAIIIGSAGSSYPLEAANLANTSAIVQDFHMYSSMPLQHRMSTLQGSCLRPPKTWGNSLLLPRGSCR